MKGSEFGDDQRLALYLLSWRLHILLSASMLRLSMGRTQARKPSYGICDGRVALRQFHALLPKSEVRSREN